MRRLVPLLVLVFLLGFASAEPQKSARSTVPRAAWPVFGVEINNTLGNSPQQNPRIVQTSDGNYLTVWEDSRYGFTALYAQKCDESGNRLWDKNGVAVCDSDGNQNFAQVIADDSGGAIITWQDYRNGSTDIFAQRLGFRGEALWNSEGVAVCQAAAGQFAPDLTTDGAGGAIIVWHDYRNSQGEDIYIQRLDKSGNMLWEKDGLPLCSAIGTQWFPKIASDGSGGAIVVWMDGRISSSDNNIFGQRVSPAGKMLWEKDGLPISSAPQNQEKPVIIGAEGGAIVAWNDSRSGNVDIYCQKIDANGSSLWEKDGLEITSAPFSQQNPKLAPDGSGGAIIVWSDNREEENAIFAQRVIGSGKTGWGENGRTVAKSSARQENPEVVKANDASWVIFWEDYRDGKPAIAAQCLNLSGAPLWEGGGIRVAGGAKFQEKPAVVASSAAGFVLAWQDRRSGNYDIFCQKLSVDGSLLWGSNGLPLCEAPGLVIHQSASLLDNGRGEVIIIFEDARSGFTNIYAQKFNRQGALLWGKDGIPVAKVRANQTNPQMVSDGAGGAIIVWEDARNSNYLKIYSQRISVSGKKVWEKGSLPLTKIDSRQSHPLLISDDAGGAIVVWQDERNPLSYKDLYAQRVSGAGDFLWGKNGLALCSENGDQVEAAVLSDGEGGIILTWADFRRGERNPDIYAQRFAPDGPPLWQKEGVLVCGAPDVQRMPQIASDNQGGAYITWTDKGGGSYDIYAQRINSRGQTQWLADGIPVNQTARTQQNSIISSSGILVWEDYRFGNWDVFAGKIAPEGRILWGESGLSVVNLPLTQYAPKVVDWDKDSLIVGWEDYRIGKQYEIYLQKINANGTSAWPENGVLVKTRNGARAPRLLALPEENALIVVWEDYTGGGKALYGQRFIID
jgi:hypothetical protein